MLHLLRRRHHPNPLLPHHTRSISNLKVKWRKDHALDSALDRDKRYALCSRVVREVLNEPGQRIPLRYLAKRRLRLRLPTKLPAFLSRHPNLFTLYPDRIKPNTSPVPFLRPSPRLLSFLQSQTSLQSLHEPLAVSKLARLLAMSRDGVVSAEKIFNVKRDLGLPDDFLTTLIPKNPNHFRLVGAGVGSKGGERTFIELVSFKENDFKSVIETRAEADEKATGVRMRPNFVYNLPSGFYLKREMREWVRDWLEMPYISPYKDASGLHPASPEMEKRTIGLLHELLSLTLMKRMAVPVIGKFCEEFRLSNAFMNAFTRHSGIFYLSLKGGIKTAVLREAYEGGELIDRDPLLEIKDLFVEMMEEGHREYLDKLRGKKERLQGNLVSLATENAAIDDIEEDDELSVSDEDKEDESFEEEDEL